MSLTDDEVHWILNRVPGKVIRGVVSGHLELERKERAMAEQRPAPRAAALRLMMLKLSEELARLEELPQEPTLGTVNTPGEVTPPPVIYFRKSFNDAPFGTQGKLYDYVAVRCGGLWYLSGPRMGGRGFAWDDLVEWLETTGPMPTIYFVSGLEELWSEKSTSPDSADK